jgi:hypothetical protein
MTASSPPHDNWRIGEPLRPIEEEMRAAAAAGEQLDRGGGECDLDTMPGVNRTVRAEVLRYLLVEDSWPVHARGVWLTGVGISGDLDLANTTLRCPLRLECCYFSSSTPVNFDYASVSVLSIHQCYLAGLSGRTLSVSKYLILSDSTFTGRVWLQDADIGGQFDCRNARLNAATGDDTFALMADGIKVRGSVDLDEVTTKDGSVRLLGADIGSQLRCSGAQLNGVDEYGNALSADGIRVGGDVYLDQVASPSSSGGKNATADASPGKQLTAAGTVRFPGADIRGQLSCQGAQLDKADNDGIALRLDGMKVGGDVYLDKEFTAAGTVQLSDSVLAGTLRFGGAHLNKPAGDKPALLADGMKVGSDVLFDDGFTATGALSLKSACVAGSLVLKPARLADDTALDASGAQVTHNLHWEPRERVNGLVKLEDAVVGELQDFWTGPDDKERPNAFWPSADKGINGNLLLDGFTYTRIGGRKPATPEQRLAWLGSHRKRVRDKDSENREKRGFAPRPYEQLATVYQQAGQDAEAREVAIAQRRDLRRYGDLRPSSRAWNWLFDVTIGYGYRTGRAAIGLVILYLLVFLASWAAQHQADLIVPAQSIAGLHPVPTAMTCVTSYPCFSPAGYAVDTVIPLINIHQADFWRPNASVRYGWIFEVLTWAGTAFGWAIATLIVAGYTGLVRSSDKT